jgi:hypothetical protein
MICVKGRSDLQRPFTPSNCPLEVSDEKAARRRRRECARNLSFYSAFVAD